MSAKRGGECERRACLRAADPPIGPARARGYRKNSGSSRSAAAWQSSGGRSGGAAHRRHVGSLDGK